MNQADGSGTPMHHGYGLASARPSSWAGGLIPVIAPGAGPGAGRIDFAFGVTPKVFVLEERGAAAVFPQRVRRAVQKSAVAGRVEMLQLTEQVCFCKILGVHAWHVVLL
jgi:hypothetical protein